MTIGLLGRKVGMMRLYEPGGRVRGVSVIELPPNRVTMLRTRERDGYEAVQIGAHGNKKRINRPERGHLRGAGLDGQVLDMLQEFRVDSLDGYEVGQALTVERFEPGQFVNVVGTSKGRGFAGGVRRWNFRGGPKTHGQSDRHRAPGSIGSGTTPGRVFKGQKMAGHMGAEKATITNLLVVLTDPERNLIFVEGSIPGPRGSLVTVMAGRRAALRDFQPPVLPTPEVTLEPEPAAPEEPEAVEPQAVEPAAQAEGAPEGAAAEELGTNTVTAEEATEAAVMGEEPEATAETGEATDEEKSEA
jgi:large subunit ribosomal protein L3